MSAAEPRCADCGERIHGHPRRTGGEDYHRRCLYVAD